MKRSRILYLLLAFLFVTTAGASGCREIKKLLPASTIENPAEGTPEWLVTKTLEAGLAPDSESGWKILRPHLHSTVTDMVSSEKSFVDFNFAAFRRKVANFIPEAGKLMYKLDYTQEDRADAELQLFVVNKGSDMPSPWRIVRDAKQANAWKIRNIP